MTVFHSSFRQILFLLVFLLWSPKDVNSNNFQMYGQSPISASGIYIEVINNLIDHIMGTAVLSDAELEGNRALIEGNIQVLESDPEAVAKSFELIELFETNLGPLFMTDNTRNGFNRNYATDGRNLHRNIILIQQGLVDHAYSKKWLTDSVQLFDGKFFQCSEYFPGPVKGTPNPDETHQAIVRASYMLGKGSQPWATIGNENVIRPTGCYLAPGSIAEISVPLELVDKGFMIRVGAHYWNLENKGSYKRMDRVSITYDINAPTIRVAHPLGGGIYLEVPLGVDEGLVEISLKNVVRAPFFSKKTFHETTLEEWQQTERNHPAPWADFETDKFMMQVPTSWIYAFDDPKSLLEDWDKSMDAVSDLLGRPRIVDRHKNYLQFDVIIRGGAYHPGYPMSNTPYNPHASTNGTPNHNILRGPQYGQDIHFHELGHEVAISKFAGETEAIVNFLYVPVLNRCFGVSLDEAFQRSFGPSYNHFQTKDHTVQTRLVSNTFCEGQEREKCNCTKNEVRYQHRGYAHYVDIVELYGWEALERFWQDESDAADMGNPYPVNNQPQDDRIFRMSKAAGVDLRPLFHFWGIHPDNQDELAQRMADHDLKLPMNIKKKLHEYRDLIPSNYDEFVDFGNELYDDFLNYSGTQFDFGPGWYKVAAETYDESKADKIKSALSDIIVYYYGTDCFDLENFVEPEFGFDTEVCKRNKVMILPTISDNGVKGTWTPAEIDASMAGSNQAIFVPELDQCACEDTVTILVVEQKIEILGDSILCFGDTLRMRTADTFNHYSWTLNGQDVGNERTIQIVEGGVLRLIASDTENCLFEGEVEIVQNPRIDIFMMNDSIAVSGGTEPYQITLDTTGTTITAMVIDVRGCQEIMTFTLSNNEKVDEEDINLFPNPAQHVIYVVGQQHAESMEIVELLDMQGQIVRRYSENYGALDLSGLESGVYVVSMQIKEGQRIQKRIVLNSLAH